MYVIIDKCFVNLFVKGILAAGSCHVKAIAAQPYASQSVVLSELQPIRSLQGRDVARHFLLVEGEPFQHLIDYCYENKKSLKIMRQTFDQLSCNFKKIWGLRPLISTSLLQGQGHL